MDSAVITSTLTGANLQDALGTALVGAVVGAVVGAAAGQAAHLIGDLTANNPALKALGHTLAGCVAGAAGQSGQAGCLAGAAGAVVGELAAAWYDPNGLRPPQETLAYWSRRTRQASATCWLTLQSLMKWFLGWQKKQVFLACSSRRSRIKP